MTVRSCLQIWDTLSIFTPFPFSGGLMSGHLAGSRQDPSIPSTRENINSITTINSTTYSKHQNHSYQYILVLSIVCGDFKTPQTRAAW